MACQHQNIDEIMSMMDEETRVHIIRQDGSELKLSYHEISRWLEPIFEDNHTWDFDLIHKTERSDEDIIIVHASREKEAGQETSESLWIMTFTEEDGHHLLKRVYVEKLKSFD
ncbi:nuclear transport factor 2 family protein [Macrococcus equipercicus]|nr:nuclear transport factor 2 family protein [Macrococcus equipercicus]UTH13245.1 nuclear transport factor 2 family protein [Macrococcus equipercicus]